MYMNNSKTSQTAGSASLSAPAKKAAYQKPSISIIEVESTTHLMDTSFPGQHNPATPGTGPTPTRAGRGFGWLQAGESEEEE